MNFLFSCLNSWHIPAGAFGADTSPQTLSALVPPLTPYLSCCLSPSPSPLFFFYLSPCGRPLGRAHTHVHTLTGCIRVAVIYNAAPLSPPDKSYKQTIDMEMERCCSLAGAACFVNGFNKTSASIWSSLINRKPQGGGSLSECSFALP